MDFKCKNCGNYSDKELAKLPKKERLFIKRHEVVEANGLYSKFCDKRLMYDNHSCNPNTLGSGKGFGIVVRDIVAGGEVTSDYRHDGEVVHFPGGCKCGENNCMGKTTFRPPASKELRRFWNARVKKALKLIPYVRQPLKRALLAEHPDLDYLFEKPKRY